MKTLALFGSTGSIGTSTLDIVRARPDDFKVKALTAHSNWEKLAEQAREFSPDIVVISNEAYQAQLKEVLEGSKIEVLAGEAALIEVAKIDIDLHIAAIVGIAGLKPVFSAVKAGNDVALANKEALVCAGDLLLSEAKKNNVNILPVDSEHNAIFQVFDQNSRDSISKVILTASGGPFRTKNRADLSAVTRDQALKHPNWSMGAKISIDSATMANKALEMIEAVYLFDLRPEELEVVIHPQSLIHSMVEYKDGSVLAQMGAPDMKTPIGYALNWPSRGEVNSQRLDFTKVLNFEFYPVDYDRFHTVDLMRDIIKTDLNKAIVFNAANEIAVDAFLKQKIAFLEIEPMIQECLEHIEVLPINTIDDVFALDLETRHYAHDIVMTNRIKAGTG